VATIQYPQSDLREIETRDTPKRPGHLVFAHGGRDRQPYAEAAGHPNAEPLAPRHPVVTQYRE